jgi:hypothetical protein
MALTMRGSRLARGGNPPPRGLLAPPSSQLPTARAAPPPGALPPAPLISAWQRCSARVCSTCSTRSALAPYSPPVSASKCSGTCTLWLSRQPPKPSSTARHTGSSGMRTPTLLRCCLRPRSTSTISGGRFLLAGMMRVNWGAKSGARLDEAATGPGSEDRRQSLTAVWLAIGRRREPALALPPKVRTGPGSMRRTMVKVSGWPGCSGGRKPVV